MADRASSLPGQAVAAPSGPAPGKSFPGFASYLVAGIGLVFLLSSAMLLGGLLAHDAAARRAQIERAQTQELALLVAELAAPAAAGRDQDISAVLAKRARQPDVAAVSYSAADGERFTARGQPPLLLAPDWFAPWLALDLPPAQTMLRADGTLLGRISLQSSPNIQLNAAWDSFALLAAIVILTLAVNLAGLAFALLRGVRPLRMLAAASRALGAGQLDVRLPLTGGPETRAALAAFNRTAEDIQNLLVGLKASQAQTRRLAEIVRQADEAIITLDLRGQITSWNAGAERLFGYSSGEMLGHLAAELYPAHTREPSWVQALSALRAGTGATAEELRRARDGRALAVLSTNSPLYDENGALIGQINLLRDLTALRGAEAAALAEKERLYVTLRAIADGVITTDAEGRIELINPVAAQLSGWTCESAAGRSLTEVFRIVDADSRAPLPDPFVRLRGGYPLHDPDEHVLLLRPDDDELSVDYSCAPIRASDERILGMVLVFHDVSERRRLSEQLSWQATHDALTGLVNRREFEHRLEQMIERSHLLHREHALLYLDLDQFKLVNDTCGHHAGDELLRQVALLMQHGVRASDTIARLGGDEFGVLLEDCPLAQAERVAQHLLESVQNFRFGWEQRNFVVGVSIGMVMVDSLAATPAKLLGAADAACYAAKDAGRNRIQIYRPDDLELTRRHGEMEWVARINQAIEEQRFVLYAQPIAATAPGSPIRHVEMLLRMRDEQGRLVPPGQFIPAAERYNLMTALDRWVVDASFAWLAAYPDLPVTTAINLSGQSLGDERFLAFVQERLRESRVAARRVCFEITETAAIANLARASEFIGALKALGCKFALDDFGSGLSSFGYLKNLPVDFLKIDGCFVRDMARDPIDRAMVEAINHIGHVMGIATIAEFTENDEIRAHLHRIGVDYAQGYGIAKPCPLEQITALLTRAPVALAAGAGRG